MATSKLNFILVLLITRFWSYFSFCRNSFRQKGKSKTSLLNQQQSLTTCMTWLFSFDITKLSNFLLVQSPLRDNLKSRNGKKVWLSCHLILTLPEIVIEIIQIFIPFSYKQWKKEPEVQWWVHRSYMLICPYRCIKR